MEVAISSAVPTRGAYLGKTRDLMEDWQVSISEWFCSEAGEFLQHR
jgi:hypothetical protein